MNAPVTAVATEAQRIEAAMDALLTACTNYKAPYLGAERGPISAGILASEFLERCDWSPAQRSAGRLLDDPVGEALRQAIRTLAERLFEVGGLRALQGACDRVADMDPARWGKRTDIMDKRFDGLGGWCA